MRFRDFQNLAKDDLKATSQLFEELLQYTVHGEAGRVTYRNSEVNW